MLVVDELHNALGGRGDSRREFLNLLRCLGNELRIPLAGVGIREAYLAIRADDQLENRFGPLTLPHWEADAEACSLLAGFAASFPLRRPSPITTMEMAGATYSPAAKARSASWLFSSPTPRWPRSSPARRPSTSAPCCWPRTRGRPNGVGASSAS